MREISVTPGHGPLNVWRGQWRAIARALRLDSWPERASIIVN
jgi:hypothetical protein